MAGLPYFVYEGELLHQAAIYDQAYSCLEQLLTDPKNGHANSKDGKGRTPVHTASQHGSTKNLKLLLESGGNPNFVSLPSDDSSTPTHHAAFNGHLPCLQLLVEHGADLDIKNVDGLKPIEVAVQQSQVNCVHFLKKEAEKRRLEQEAKLEEELKTEMGNGNFHQAREIITRLGEHFDVNKEYMPCRSLLLAVSEKGDIETVNLLIKRGAISSPNPFTGITPLYAACVQGHVDVARSLIQHFPQSVQQGTKVENNYPLHIVCGSGNLEITKLLLQSEDGSEPWPCIGLDVNCQTSSGMTPLHNAATAGNLTIVEQLLDTKHQCVPPCRMKSEISVNARSKVGRTALHDAVTLGHVDVARVLLEHHAKPNCVARTDELVDFEDFYEELQDEMADMVDVNNMMVTPLELACYQKNVEMVKVLLKYKAEDLGNKCLQYLVANKEEELIELLLGTGVHPSEEYKLPPKLREERNDMASVSIVWHNYSLNKLEHNWLWRAPKTILRAEVAATLSKTKLLATITNLDLSKNRLESLPIEIFQLPSLKHFNASNNTISMLPSAGGKREHANFTPDSVNDDVFDDDDKEQSSSGSMWYCPHLEEIELQNNNLTLLPSYLFMLPALKVLNASKNDIQSVPFELWLTPNLKTVILSNNYIKSLQILPNASDVFSSNMNIPGKRRKAYEPFDEDCRALPSSDRERPAAEDESKDGKGLRVTSFRSLWNDGHEEHEDSEEDEDVEGQAECPLEKLDLSFNQVTSFPVGLPCLAPKLSKLLLSNNNIEKFPPIQEIPEQLSLLDLSFNRLKQCLPAGRDYPIDRLCLSPVQGQRRRTSKKRGRSRTSGSAALVKQSCRHCRHRHLSHMKRLELGNNFLRVVHFVRSTRATVTKTNSLNNVCVEEESAGRSTNPGQCFFPNLISLTLNDNKLESLTPELGQLTKLGSLNVSNNPLTKSQRLPPEIGMLGDLWDLNLKGLTLTDPPASVLEKRTKAITGYLLSVLDNAKPYPNMKLMFVGVANIGKTTLLAKLREDNVGAPGWHERRDNKKVTAKGKKSDKNVSTVGVDVSEWIFANHAGLVFRTRQPSIRFSTWDFGGQNEYYATHQCFLSQRALYLAIWKLTDGEQGVRNLEPWLLNIQARAPDSIVLIVGTFYDRLSSQQRKNNFVEDMHKLIFNQYVSAELGGDVRCPRERGLPKVVQVIDVSCTTGYNIDKLRQAIYNAALEIKGPGKHSLLEEQLIPASYLAVETAVKDVTAQCYEANQTPVLKAEQFRRQIQTELERVQVKLRDQEELEQACQFLHDNGVLLHYDDPSLSGLYFLDPQWLCDMLAHVVAIRDVNPLVQNGVMRFSDLSQLFRSARFPSHLIREYVDLLNKFEVALPWSTEHLLVPSLLPEDQIVSRHVMAPGVSNVVARSMNMAAYTENRVLRRQYVMSYVPSGFWARLITRMIDDKQLKSVVGECMEFLMDGRLVVVDEHERSKIAQPEWSCWKTGLELSCYGVKLLRVSQLHNVPFYGCPDEGQSYTFLLDGCEQPATTSNVVEIVAPSVVMAMEKFVVHKGIKSDPARESGPKTAKNYIGFRVKSVSDSNIQTAARFLSLTVDHIDTLLSDWYPGLDTTNLFGENLVTRRILCGKCVNRVINTRSSRNHRGPDEDTQETGQERASPQSSHSEGDDTPRRSTCEAVGNSKFYMSRDVGKGSEEAGANDDVSEPVTCNVECPSSDSESSSGLGTDSSCRGSVDSHMMNFDDREDSFPRRNGYDSDADNSRTSSQTSGVPPSPRHEETRGGAARYGRITAFEFEECVVSSHSSDYVTCPDDGELALKELAPDVVFADIAPQLKVDPVNFTRKKFLGRGSFGTVYAGEVKQDGKALYVAVKMPLDYELGENPTEAELAAAKAAQRKAEEVPKLIFTDAYRTIRQELSILINLNHPHILQLKGFCLSPLSLILEFAPLKSLDKILAKYKRTGQRLDPYVLQKCVIQCSAALKYLHKHHIVYRDLKSENILVWEFPEPFSANQPGHEILLKIADYGISRSAAIAGSKGLSGTPGFMAPEIEKYSGREAYTDKVDSFSFGMFLYELITLGQPFIDLSQAQIKQFIVEGKRPPLTSKDKRAPVFALELMSWCWCPNPEDRPSSSQIHSVSICSEFPRLMDVLTFDEALNLSTSITAGSRGYTGHGADGQLGVGKEVWLFHSKLEAGVKRETVDVLCYSNGRSNHLEEYVVGKNTIRVACSVGSTVWLGSDPAFIYVYCAITHKQLCQGSLPGDKYILSMIHFPKCNCVMVSLSNGQVVAYSDNVYTHTKFKESCDVTTPKELEPLRKYTGAHSVHCMAAVAVPRTASPSNARGLGTNRTAEVQMCYEVWCGEQKGRIAVLNAETLIEKGFLPAEDCDLDNPCLENLTVTKLETCQTYAGTIAPGDSLASSVWVAVYPGTCVYRYDARLRKIVNSVDCSQNRPSNEGSLQIYGPGKTRKVTKFQVLSLLVVNRELFIGTSSGCFLVCNSLSLLVYSVIRCHDTSLECLLPLTTTPVTWNLGTDEHAHEEHSRLVLTCGKGYRSICPGRVGNSTSSNALASPGKRGKSFILVWLADERETAR